MNIHLVSDMEFISTLMNILRTNSITNTNWTYTFDFKVNINVVSVMVITDLYQYFVCRKHLCVVMLPAMLLLKHV